MRVGKWAKIFGFLLGLLAALPQVYGDEGSGAYSSLFTEEVLEVTRERDGLLPGTLRTVLIQASGIRSQNSFTLVRIVFAPQVRRVRITKGPLPEIDGSLTTLDCSNPQGRVTLEYVDAEDDAGYDPSAEEASVLTLTSNGNLIRNCHITGAPGPGIRIYGNRNVIEHSAIGYHADVPETNVPASALYDPPKSNGRAGIYLGKGANENVIQHNDIVGNTYHGVLLDNGVGTANKINYNYFSRNSGQPIKAQPGTRTTLTPTIQKISQIGDSFVIEGIASPRATVQIYMVGENKGEVGMLVSEANEHPSNTSAKFEIETKSKGFTLGKTQLTALAHGVNMNSSEFSEPIVVGKPKSDSDNALSPEGSPEDGDTAAEQEEDESEPVDGEEDYNSQDLPQPRVHGSSAPAETNSPGEESPDRLPSHHSSTGSSAGRSLGQGESETVINLEGQGDGGSTPDSGTDRQNEVSSLGI